MRDFSDLARRIENMLRVGVIAEVDHRNYKARVKTGEILTDWLKFMTFRAGTSSTWSPPTIGEQCLILALSGELTTAFVLTGIYSLDNPPPSTNEHEHVFDFADGARITYSTESSALNVTGIKTANVVASKSITATTPLLRCTENVIIEGNLKVNGGISSVGDMQSQGNIELQGDLTAIGEVTGKGKHLSTHVHTGVMSGDSTSGQPQ